MQISSYPSVYNLGHAALANLFDGPVTVEEKCDGSQISFKATDDGGLHIRSKGQEIIVDAPQKMFEPAVATIERLRPDLNPGWTYRGEFLAKPHHNALTYNRVPEGNIIIFDIDAGDQDYMPWQEKAAWASDIGLEVVPLLYDGEVGDWQFLKDLLDRESVLGGAKIEGFVIKNYAQYGRDKKVLMGKYVSEAFKEKHIKEWGKANPTNRDILETLTQGFRSEARWQKAIQHLRDAGLIEGSPRDIGPLIKEVQADIRRDSVDEIKEILFKWAWPHIERKSVAGLAEFYKERLAESAFEKETVSAE